MSKPEFGMKHTCDACAVRFYDLNRSPVICFKCGAEQAPAKPRMYRAVGMTYGRGSFSRRPQPVAAREELEPVADPVDEDVEDADVEEVEAVLEDDDAEDAVEVEIISDERDGSV